MYGINKYGERAKREIKGRIKICNTEVFMFGRGLVKLIEYNPQLNVKSSVNSFWEFLEYEHKFDVKGEFSFGTFHNLMQNKKYGRFESGMVEVQKTYERFISIQGPHNFGHVVILGKRGWKKKRAIKRKEILSKESGFYERKVSICEFTKNGFVKIAEDICESSYENIVKKYMRSMRKEKHRVVFIDRYEGYVYGVSYSEAVTQDLKRESFKQIEVEFWSKIISSEDYIHGRKIYSKDNHMKLVRKIKNVIENSGLCLENGKSKYEWLCERSNSGADFSIEKQKFD